MPRNKKDQDPNAIPQYLLQALRDCSATSRYGFVDKGNPRKLQKLSMLGYVKFIQDGYQITDAGKAYLSSHRKDLLRL